MGGGDKRREGNGMRRELRRGEGDKGKGRKEYMESERYVEWERGRDGEKERRREGERERRREGERYGKKTERFRHQCEQVVHE